MMMFWPVTHCAIIYSFQGGRGRPRSDLEESDRLRSVNITLLVEDSLDVTVNGVGV